MRKALRIDHARHQRARMANHGAARLEEAYPPSMLIHGQTLNLTAFSSAGRFNVGIVGCRDRLPHLQRLALHMADALAELEAATRKEQAA